MVMHVIVLCPIKNSFEINALSIAEEKTIAGHAKKIWLHKPVSKQFIYGIWNSIEAETN